MGAQTRPPFRRRKLGKRLRGMREAARMNLDVAAARLDKTRSSLQRMEAGETRVDVHLARSMMDLYDVFDAGLVDEVRRSLKPGWWVAHGVRDMGYLDLETEACLVREFAGLTVPGLLQTEPYVRALLSSGSLERTPEELDTQVVVRLHRQRRLGADLDLIALVDEAALRRQVGGPEVMRAQLEHLAATDVDLRVLPLSRPHSGLEGGFIVLSFPEPGDDDMLYVAHAAGSVHIEAPADVNAATLKFGVLCSEALSRAESTALIEGLLRE
ncbi:Scr1 family TA system antitoxin-like transcriptional regulator [Umezawaea beigongshangensis]|uniref:Scr1 family TA system antitoxin-like transcriptional regulator n=1 Tax=Umezawaea beigongshangensis TaxID=2780383 RepID=UPI0027DBAC3E|nr:Scr1 family TA system antitoxin-like transcriptional regulator [Umezawaea beigongshangensis]